MSVSLTRRSKVLLALVASMTLGCGLLLGMHGPPIQAVQQAGNATEGPATLIGVQPNATTASERAAQPAASPTPAPSPIPVVRMSVMPPPEPVWQRIAVHQTGDAGKNLADVDSHYKKQFGGCIYHFVIRPDGKVEESAIWKNQKLAPAELEGNLSGLKTIHIALVGQFSMARPTEKQLQAVRAKIKELAAQYRIADVDVQPAVNNPGPNFPQKYPF